MENSLGAVFQFAFLAAFLIPAILYLLTLQNTLKAISPDIRMMEPGQVWLILIPFFGLYWQFVLVDKLSRSIGAECVRLNIPHDNYKPTFGIGITMGVFNCLFWIPILGFLGSLIFFIIHWVKVNEFRKLIIGNQFNFTLDAERNIFHGDKRSGEDKLSV